MMNVWFQTDEAAQQCSLQGPLCLGMHISVFKEIQWTLSCSSTTQVKRICTDPRYQHDHLCVICQYSHHSTIVNHPLKPQIGTPSDKEAHQLVLLFLRSQPRRPEHQSWSVCKVHICILHFPPRPHCYSVGGREDEKCVCTAAMAG